jgi:MraZ protein
MPDVLIGNYAARFDASGRIKIPQKFREVVERVYGRDLFITSLTDESVHIYPLAVWLAMTGAASEGTLHLRPDVRRFMLRVNRNGAPHEIDSKGRVLVNQALRDKARLRDDVEVLGMTDHMEVWNREALDATLSEKPLSEEDFMNIARLVPRGKIE